MKFTYPLHVQTKVVIGVDVALTLLGKRTESCIGDAIDEGNESFL